MKGENVADHKTIMNDQIRTDTVRLIDSDGTQVGIIRTSEAMKMAISQSLDLVLVSEDANPPVGKIMDHGKMVYDAKKRRKESKAKQIKTTTKEIQLRPTTDIGDLTRKINDAKRFLSEGNQVRFSLRFRGRERTHPEKGMEKMEQILSELGENVNIQKPPLLNGNQILMVVG